MRSILNKLSHRYESYVDGVAEIASLPTDKARLLVYIGVTAIANYMVYQEDVYIDPLLDIIEKELQG